MLKKKFEKLNEKEQRKIYNSYIQMSCDYKNKTYIIITSMILVLFIQKEEFIIPTSIIFMFIIFIYLILIKNSSEKWYYCNKENILKNNELSKIIKKKRYNELNKEEKLIIQNEYRKNEEYSPLEKSIFYMFIIESIILCIRRIISINDIIYVLIIVILYLIYDLIRMKKWYKKKSK